MTYWSDPLLRDQVRRAEKLNLPATLTQKQWANTRQHFNNQCAYCRGGRYEVFEHFLPINWNGGTIYGNCVPACLSCNTCKDHPKFILFSNRELAMSALWRVFAYLKKTAPGDIDQQRIDEYLEYQRVRVPIHHNGVSRLVL